MAPVVLKFGGTSVQDEAALGRLANIVARTDGPRIVVVSAVAGVTNILIDAAAAAARGDRAGSWVAPVLDQHIALACATLGSRRRQAAIDRLTDVFAEAASLLSSGGPMDAARRDAVLACGELASSSLVAAVLADAGLDSAWVDARRVIVTDERHGAARPRRLLTEAAAARELMPALEAGHIPVLGGFVGATSLGAATTLGRGGSDYSAGVIGAAVRASRVEIWTDVDGILSADPRIVPDAVLLDAVSGVEAYDLARFGARVLHAGTLEPVAEPRIPVVVRNARRPAVPGTEIRHGAGYGCSIAGLAHRPAVSLIDLESRDLGSSTEFLNLVAECVDHGANHAVTPVAVSPQRAIMAADSEAVAEHLCERMRRVADVAPIVRGGLVAVVGRAVQGEPGVWRTLLQLRESGAVNRVIQASSGAALVAFTAPGSADDVLRELHACVVGVRSAMEVAS